MVSGHKVTAFAPLQIGLVYFGILVQEYCSERTGIVWVTLADTHHTRLNIVWQEVFEQIELGKGYYHFSARYRV